MKIVQLLSLIAGLLHKIVDHLASIKAKRKEQDYQNDIEIIEDDPVTYANDKYGKLRKRENDKQALRGGADGDS